LRYCAAMNRRLKAGLAALLLLAALAALARHLAWEKLQEPRFILRKQGSKTPGTFGLAYQDLTFDSGGRQLKAFYVAPPPGGPALLILHGNGESISSWTPVQKLLFDHGVGSLVFDYSGFGRSQGPARVELFPRDAQAAWRELQQRLPPGTRACAYGLSLGTGVLLEAAPRLKPAPDCLALWGSYTSLVGAGVRTRGVPRWLSPFLPDALVSLDNIARAPAPVLIEHGGSDDLFPPEDAQALSARAPPGSRLLVLPGYKHAQPIVSPDEGAWVPVVAWVRGVPEGAVAPVVPPKQLPEAPVQPGAALK
jgi:uncharacterized protein